MAWERNLLDFGGVGRVCTYGSGSLRQMELTVLVPWKTFSHMGLSLGKVQPYVWLGPPPWVQCSLVKCSITGLIAWKTYSLTDPVLA